MYEEKMQGLLWKNLLQGADKGGKMKRAPSASSNRENVANDDVHHPEDALKQANNDGHEPGVQITFNGHLSLLPSTAMGGPIALHSAIATCVARRHLNCKIADASAFFNGCLEGYARRLSLQVENPCTIAGHPIRTVGRITTDNNEKLTVRNAVLECGKGPAGGSMVSLDFSKYFLPVGLFPGQMMAVEGENVDGKSFVVHKILTSGEGTQPSSVQLANKPFKMAVASATACDDFEVFDHLESVLEKAFDSSCDCLVLFGPVLNANNENVQLGRLQKEPTEYYRHVMSRLQLLTANSHCTVLFVPTMNDFLADPVYPMNGLTTGDVSLPDRVYLVNGPQVVSLNGLDVGIVPADILMHLSAEEVSLNSPAADRIGRLCEHLIEQRSFYPLYPGHPSVNIDYQKGEALMFSSSPHLIVLSSLLKPFVKKTDSSTIFVNPGPKNYAIVHVHPGPQIRADITSFVA